MPSGFSCCTIIHFGIGMAAIWGRDEDTPATEQMYLLLYYWKYNFELTEHWLKSYGSVRVSVSDYYVDEAGSNTGLWRAPLRKFFWNNMHID